MPIFQDDLGEGQETPSRKQKTSPVPGPPLVESVIKRKISEESIRTELCEGPLLESPPGDGVLSSGLLETTFKFPINGTLNRAELIERLKRGESPTWLSNRNLDYSLERYDKTARQASTATERPSPLLPSPNISEINQITTVETEQVGQQIERPRSALHSGDFTEGPRQVVAGEHSLMGAKPDSYRQLNTSAWLATSPPASFLPFQLDPRFPPPDVYNAVGGNHSRTPSLSSSYSSSFFLKPPTSPLVQSESNEDVDLSSRMNPIDITSRRHTLQAPDSVLSTPSISSTSTSHRPLPLLRRDNAYPYQAHQPRRSLNSNQIPHPTPSPQTPMFLRSRRPSYTSDSSPLHASMVGSYEESILRGRMSTTPSRPLDFVAQIGVLGLAVFYSYETTSHGRTVKAEDGPSPYVGQIDLENTLQNPDDARDVRRKRHSANMARNVHEDFDMLDIPNGNQLSERELRRAEKQKRRSTSPRAPAGGSYRIPEKGQLQIIIKNPNKTAVKLFLVPYDLAGMEPGTKTFIRQRSYSAGPIIDSALSSTQQVPTSSPLDRPTLRYLVHLHICSPSRGRFYLYKSIRVVFANRVPDGKERLRNEISLPEPRFSVYKPGRESGINGGAGASLAAEKAYRRRSSGFALGPLHRTHDTMDGINQALERGFGAGAGHASGRDASTTLVQPIPFSLYQKPVVTEDGYRFDDIQSPTSSKSSQPPGSRDSGMQMSWTSNSTQIGGYDKLSKGDLGYGGNAFTGSPDGKLAEGLLAKKLKGLGVGVLNQQDQLDGL